MRALFVHGMARSSLSGLPLLWQLQRHGLSTGTFGYFTSFESVDGIGRRLSAKIMTMASQGPYLLIGHSLGGVLLRSALGRLDPDVRPPQRLFLLGSPVRPSRLARRLRPSPIYRVLAGDCGQLLASEERMAGIGPPSVPTTAIIGERTLPWKNDPFEGESNDGVVSMSEVCADWVDDRVCVDVVHTFLPSSRKVGDVILSKLSRLEASAEAASLD